MPHPADQRALADSVRGGIAPAPALNASGPSVHHDNSAPEWRSYFRTLYGARWLIVTVAGLCVFGALLYALAAPPVYEAQMLIYVEEDSPNAPKNILNEMSSLFETKKAAIAEMELLRSRLVVARAVDELRLYIDAAPRYFPLAGFRIASWQGRALSTPGLFGHGGYAWGGEQIDVRRFDVPEAQLEREFVLTAQDGGQYVLRDGAGHVVLSGQVGTLASGAGADGSVSLQVGQLAALPGAQFRLRRTSRLRALQALQTGLVITEQGKQSGVIEVKLLGNSAQQVNAVLSAIGDEYMRQNLARKKEEAEKTLAFLDVQLPALKGQLEQAEASYNHFRAGHDTVNLGEEVRLGLQRAADLKARYAELTQKRIDLLSRFTDAHPVVAAVNQQLRETGQQSRALEAQIKTWPQLEQEETRLARDVKVSTDLYMALLNTSQQLRLLSVGRVANVRLVDAPVAPDRPIRPQRALVVALAGVTGLFLGALLAFARKTFKGGIDEAEQIEAMLGARAVYATIPHSRAQGRLHRRTGVPAPLLAQTAPDDAAIESLRAFRAALQFALPHCRNNIVQLVGPTRGVGAAFASLNLALLLASGGKRTLLIDADLRAGQLHTRFGIAPGPGLADALCGAMQAEQVVRHAVMDKLDLIPAGAAPLPPADFLQHLNFGSLLDALRAHYDVVLIVTPPVLAAADALIIGTHAGAVFLVARAGNTTQDELKDAIKRLNHAGIAPHGIVFNDVPLGRGATAYEDRARGSNGLVRT